MGSDLLMLVSKDRLKGNDAYLLLKTQSWTSTKTMCITYQLKAIQGFFFTAE